MVYEKKLYQYFEKNYTFMKEKKKSIVLQNSPIFSLQTKRFTKSFFSVLINSPENYNSIIKTRIGFQAVYKSPISTLFRPLEGAKGNPLSFSSSTAEKRVVGLEKAERGKTYKSSISDIVKVSRKSSLPTSLWEVKKGRVEEAKEDRRFVCNIQTKICKQKNIRKPKNSKKLSLSELRKRGKIGFIYLTCTKNNTICTLVDPKGYTKGWNSSGTLGFKNARKSTIYAAQGAAEMIAIKAKNLGFKRACLIIKGLGRGKESSVRILRKSNLKILSVEEKTPIPHNGCRPPKKRRV